MGPLQGRVEGEENLPRPAGHTPLNARQETIGLLRNQGTLLAHGQPVIHQERWRIHFFTHTSSSSYNILASYNLLTSHTSSPSPSGPLQSLVLLRVWGLYTPQAFIFSVVLPHPFSLHTSLAAPHQQHPTRFLSLYTSSASHTILDSHTSLPSHNFVCHYNSRFHTLLASYTFLCLYTLSDFKHLFGFYTFSAVHTLPAAHAFLSLHTFFEPLTPFKPPTPLWNPTSFLASTPHFSLPHLFQPR